MTQRMGEKGPMRTPMCRVAGRLDGWEAPAAAPAWPRHAHGHRHGHRHCLPNAQCNCDDHEHRHHYPNPCGPPLGLRICVSSKSQNLNAPPYCPDPFLRSRSLICRCTTSHFGEWVNMLRLTIKGVCECTRRTHGIQNLWIDNFPIVWQRQEAKRRCLCFIWTKHHLEEVLPHIKVKGISDNATIPISYPNAFGQFIHHWGQRVLLLQTCMNF